MSRKFIIVVLVTSLALTASFFIQKAQAQTPSPEMMQQFQQLPRAQQEALARQYGFSMSEVDQMLNSQSDQEDSQTEMNNETVEEREENSAMDVELPIDKVKELSPNQLQRRLARQDQDIRPFGYDLFSGEPSTFAPVTNAAVPSNYMIGIGDRLLIQLYGKESAFYETTVDSEGNIILDTLGPIHVAGLSYDEVKRLVSETVKERMIGIEAVVSVSDLRSMQIFVVGEAYRPGAYTVSSLTTISQALFVSGGVSELASLRNIQLKRGGETISEFDLYDLLTQGDASDDSLLRHGDVVFIPPRGDMVKVHGQVKRPAYYELKYEDTLDEVIDLAGGLLPDAYRQSVRVQTYNDGLRHVRSANLNNEASSFDVNGGDDIYVDKSSDEIATGVMLVGAVNRPGMYEWEQGMRVSDVLGSLDRDLLPVADLNYALVVTPSEDRRQISVRQFDVARAVAEESAHDLELSERDQIVVFSRYESKVAERSQLQSYMRGESDRAQQQREAVLKKYREQYLLKLVENDQSDEMMSEAFRRGPQRISQFDSELRSSFDQEEEEVDPNSFSDYSRYHLLHPILFQLRNQFGATGTLPLVHIDGQVRYPGIYPLAENSDVADAIAAAGGLREGAYLTRAEITRTEIERGEAVTDYVAFNLEDVLAGERTVPLAGRDRINIFATPEWQNTLQVKLEGEVRFPGTYSIRRGETLTQLIERAGGFTDYAFVDGSIFTRSGLRNTERDQLESLAQQLRREIASNSVTGSGGGSVPVGDLNQLLEDLVNIEPVGRLIIDLPDILADNGNGQDIQLKDGDRLFIPTEQNTVSIIGEVQLGSSYRYDNKLTVDDYIELAGGFRQKADDSRLYVIKANGAIMVPNNSGWFSFNQQDQIEAGDTIVVPLDTQYMNGMELWSETTQILYQVGIALAALNGL